MNDILEEDKTTQETINFWETVSSQTHYSETEVEVLEAKTKGR